MYVCVTSHLVVYINRFPTLQVDVEGEIQRYKVVAVWRETMVISHMFYLYSIVYLP